ncbi:facilitated trehalose transporter Tret1-2 homolog [Cydia pomonella]|uniref:facilitated trehalose transporter Tret1-2 homolog n=1 Tax=Cydia pomonella TaxID=82600 RepID=UPI002ADE44F3|nr:facilitated trehalose transporter Tret1-2 homolog [Cydia pomonella]
MAPKREDITEDQETSKEDTTDKDTGTDDKEAENPDKDKVIKEDNLEKEKETPGPDKVSNSDMVGKLSNYYQNLKHDSATGLALDSNKNGTSKEETLLEDSRTVVRFSPVWKQTIAASASILITFISGLTSGYSAILLPQLKAENGTIPWDPTTQSWIAAMAALPMAPGCLIAGWMMEKFGRRTSQYIICAPLLLGWILIASATNLPLLLAGRFLTGICVGLCGPLSPVYIGETTEPKYRGFFLAGVSLAIAVGLIAAHVLGTFLTWQWTANICCLFPILAVLLLTLIPESPTWLISKGRIEEGVKAYGWLRGHSEDANAELRGILDKQKAADSEPALDWKDKLKALKSPELLKPLFIMVFFFIVCQLSGVNAVAFYSIDIMEKAVGTGMDHYVAMLVIDIVRVIMSVFACVACRRFGRRPLCFISGILTALSMIGLSMYLFATEGTQIKMSWIPLSCLMIYICAISIGLVPLPWIMCGEVFPTKVRGLGSGISSATTFTAFFAVVKTAPGMMEHLGEVITFLSYGVVALVGTGVLYFILPETKGKSLQEIEEEFKYGKKSVHKI